MRLIKFHSKLDKFTRKFLLFFCVKFAGVSKWDDYAFTD